MSSKEKERSNVLIEFRPLFFVIFVLGLIVLGVLANYFVKFHGPLDSRPEVWGQFGDYVGGTLNPLLSFFALLGLFVTITEQRRASAKAEERSNDQEFNTRVFELLALSHASVASVKILLPVHPDPDKARLVRGTHYEGHRAIAYAWSVLAEHHFLRMRPDSTALYSKVLDQISFWKRTHWNEVCNFIDSMIFLLLYSYKAASSPRQAGLAIMAIQSQLSLDERALIFYMLLSRIYDYELLEYLIDESEFFDDVQMDPFVRRRKELLAEAKLHFKEISKD